MASRISIFCLWLFCLYCWSSPSQGELAIDCCLKVSRTPIPQRIVKGYEVQTRGQGCDIEAVVFTTKQNLKLCAPTDPGWVKELMASVNAKLRWCKKRNFQPKRCNGLKV
ncbi:hypothetical protein AAFF_G00023740 [Aldrovandia affinis]|uniref:C-C motif chemokine n=1 Tax=Aldrovandia affinis TaxID=143900 RepID=A0AAD7WYX5_9TELE|nr:hypothetical protein AAFF_G00023740 [Aldrovandia affinis]